MKNLLFLVLAVVLFQRSAAQQCLYINEIMVNAAGANDGTANNSSEWTELYNACCDTLDIGCFRLSDGDWLVIIPAGTKVPPFGFYTIGSNATYSGTPSLNTSTCNCISGTKRGVYTNGNDQAVLFDPSGNVVDAVMWGSGQARTPQTAAIANCTSITVTLPPNGVVYENGGNPSIDGGTLARTTDGGSTWIQKGVPAITFNASNDNAGRPVLYINQPVSTPVCPGEQNVSVSATSTGGGSVSWQLLNGRGITGTTYQATGTTISIDFGVRTGYDTFVVSKNTGNCFLRDIVVIEVRSCSCPVILLPAANPVICAGDSLRFIADVSAKWRLLNGATTQLYAAEDTFTRVFSTPGKDTIVLTNGTNCFDTVVVTVRQYPAIVLSADTIALCAGDTARLQPSLTGGATITWSPATAISCTTCAAPQVFPPSSQRYFLKLEDSVAGCITKDSVTIDLLPLPEVLLPASDTTICRATALFLPVITRYDSVMQWSGGNGTFSSASTDTTTYFPFSSDSAYHLFATAQNRCGSAVDSILVTIQELPVALAGSDVLYCGTDTLWFYGRSSYAQKRDWTSNGSGLFMASTSDTTGYIAGATAMDTTQLYFTAGNGCGIVSDTLLVIVPPVPTVNAGPDLFLCGSKALLLQGAVTNGTAQWSGGNGSFTNPGRDTSYYTPAVADAAYFRLLLEVTNSCGSQQDTLEITRLNVPVAEAGPNDTLCNRTAKALEGVATSANSTQWYSSAAGSISMPAAAITNYTPDQTENGFYTFYFKAENVCGAAVDSLRVLYLPPPVATFSCRDTVFCEGELPVHLLPLQGGGSFSGSFVNGTHFSPEQTGIYPITYSMNSKGCPAQQTMNMWVLPKPVAGFVTTPDGVTPVEYGTPVRFVSTSKNADSFYWDFGDNTFGENAPETSHIYGKGGDFMITLIVRNDTGCSDTATRLFSVSTDEYLFIPSAFTPNADQTNDGFGIFSQGMVQARLLIYSRWGELLYSTADLRHSWDGSYKGVPCPDGNYVYIVEALGISGRKHVQKGNITLLR